MMQTTALRYLVYRRDGAELVYSGTDEAAYQAARAELAGEHAGALVGTCMMQTERWLVACYYSAEPDAAGVRRRREMGLFGLAWEPSQAGEAE